MDRDAPGGAVMKVGYIILGYKCIFFCLYIYIYIYVIHRTSHYLSMIVANDFAAGCHLWKGRVSSSLRATLPRRILALGLSKNGDGGFQNLRKNVKMMM